MLIEWSLSLSLSLSLTNRTSISHNITMTLFSSVAALSSVVALRKQDHIYNSVCCKVNQNTTGYLNQVLIEGTLSLCLFPSNKTSTTHVITMTSFSSVVDFSSVATLRKKEHWYNSVYCEVNQNTTWYLNHVFIKWSASLSLSLYLKQNKHSTHHNHDVILISGGSLICGGSKEVGPLI